VPPAYHAVGDRRRKERFYRGEEADSERRRYEALHLFYVEGRELGRGQDAREVTEAAAYGLDFEP